MILEAALENPQTELMVEPCTIPGPRSGRKGGAAGRNNAPTAASVRPDERRPPSPLQVKQSGLRL